MKSIGSNTKKPDPTVSTVVMDVPLKSLRLAPYRRRRSDGDLEGLTASIREHGVIEPLIVRPTGKVTEVVCGGRRLAAAKAAGLATAPCIVRELDDVEARAQCLEENLKRDDLHAMDEAEQYEELISDHGYAIADLVAKFAKTERHVRERLKLLVLSPKVRKAWLAGDLPDTAVFKIARIADHKQQDELLDHARETFGGPEKWELAEFDRGLTKALRDLKSAPFDIARVDLNPAAGACSSCPKRTGTQRELIEDGTPVLEALEQTGTTKSQFYRWRKELEDGTASDDGSPRVGVDGRVYRTTREKLDIVGRIAEALEADKSLTVKAAAAAEGVHPSQYREWLRLA